MSFEQVTLLLSLMGSLIGTFGGIIISSKLTTYRISQLEKKVEQHNNVIHRTYKLEQQCELFSEKFKVANERINDLEAK